MHTNIYKNKNNMSASLCEGGVNVFLWIKAQMKFLVYGRMKGVFKTSNLNVIKLLWLS